MGIFQAICRSNHMLMVLFPGEILLAYGFVRSADRAIETDKYENMLCCYGCWLGRCQAFLSRRRNNDHISIRYNIVLQYKYILHIYWMEIAALKIMVTSVRSLTQLHIYLCTIQSELIHGFSNFESRIIWIMVWSILHTAYINMNLDRSHQMGGFLFLF